MSETADILERIADLHKQATTERSHYYTAATLQACAAEIMRLRHLLAKCAEHAEDGQNGSASYALDRLAQIRKVVACV